MFPRQIPTPLTAWATYAGGLPPGNPPPPAAAPAAAAQPNMTTPTGFTDVGSRAIVPLEILTEGPPIPDCVDCCELEDDLEILQQENIQLRQGIEDWADSYISSQHALLQCQDALIEANHHKQAYRLKREQEKTKWQESDVKRARLETTLAQKRVKFAHAKRDVRRHKRRTTNALPKLTEVHDAADEILNSVRGLTSNLCRVGLEILDDKTRGVVNALNVIQHQVLDLQKGNREAIDILQPPPQANANP